LEEKDTEEGLKVVMMATGGFESAMMKFESSDNHEEKHLAKVIKDTKDDKMSRAIRKNDFEGARKNIK